MQGQRAFFALLKKDFLYEFRTGQTVVTALSFALIMSALTSFGIQNAFLEPVVRERLLAPLGWVLFLTTSSIVFGRAFSFEKASGAIDGVKVSGVSPITFYLSKCVVFFLVCVIIHFVQTLTLSFLFQNESLLHVGYGVLSLLVLFAYAALTVLLLMMSYTSRLGGVLLPLLSLPLLFPLFFAATELTQLLLVSKSIDTSSFWFALVACLDIFYFACGLALFPPVMKE